jgi:two-component system, NtrC family, response regulator AtoC
LPEQLLDRFLAYRWPGNIRELENIVERIVVLTSGSEVSLGDLPALLQAEPTPLDAISLDLPPNGISLGDVERELLCRALQECNWNQSRAARYLGLSRRTLIYRMQKYNLAGRAPLCIVGNRSNVVEIA